MDSKSKRAHSAGSGYEPQDKKHKMQAAQADKADKYLLNKHPERLPLGCMK